jgi:magnesium transporter
LIRLVTLAEHKEARPCDRHRTYGEAARAPGPAERRDDELATMSATPDPPALLGDVIGLTDRHVPRVQPGTTVGEVMVTLHGNDFATVAAIAVVDTDRMVGLVRIEDLLRAPSNASVDSIMDAAPPVVSQGTDQEVAAWTAIRRRESTVAVVDAQGTFVGLIPPPRLIEILLTEHDEDLARLGGYLRSTREARTASEERVSRRYWHRLPWLIVGLLGAILSAEVVGAFETSLETTVLIAFFLPGLVYMADAVGTQTETVIVRGLSIGVPIRRVARLELTTGLLVGLTLAAAFLPVGMLRWGSFDVVLGAAISMVAACSVATVIAMALPGLLHRVGVDPAFGSGPLATVAQDLITILIYLAVTGAIVA